MSEIPEFDTSELESSFKEERQHSGGAMPPEKMPPPAPMRGVSSEIGDQVPESFSSGTTGPSNTEGGVAYTADGQEVSTPGEYGFGRPGAAMKARRRQNPATAETPPKIQEVSAVDREPPPAPSSTPRQTSATPEEIADQVYENGASRFNFFTSSSLPPGKQWFFPGPAVMMIAKSDYFKMLEFLQLRFKRFWDHEGDGFVGDCSQLLADPTFGPMMAMAGMFHVEQEQLDESTE